jgi:branched-chain amino acid transport system ATP-binding protein
MSLHSSAGSATLPAPSSNGGGEPLLEARDLSAGYLGLAAVRNLNLEVRAGEIVALLGANGAGKTTTLLTLAGELPTLGGEVRCFGRVATTPLHKRAQQGLALVTEEKSVFMSLSARENLRLGSGEIARAVEIFPELEVHLDRRAGLLSGGQQQMLTLARALASRPKVLLADELSLGLAPVMVQRLLVAVRQAAQDGVGVLLVEQHVRQALQVAHRVYVLRRGCVVFSGDASTAAAKIEQIEEAYLEGVVAEAG